MRNKRSSPVSGRAPRGFWLAAAVVATAAAMGLRLLSTHDDASSDTSAQIRRGADSSATAAEPAADSFSQSSMGERAIAVPDVRRAAAPPGEQHSERTTVTYDESGQPKLESVEAESLPVTDHAMRRMPEVRRTDSALQPRLDTIQSVSPPASGPRLDDGLQGSGAGPETRPYLEQVAE
jgi:hypothetical protein